MRRHCGLQSARPTATARAAAACASAAAARTQALAHSSRWQAPHATSAGAAAAYAARSRCVFWRLGPQACCQASQWVGDAKAHEAQVVGQLAVAAAIQQNLWRRDRAAWGTQ